MFLLSSLHFFTRRPSTAKRSYACAKWTVLDISTDEHRLFMTSALPVDVSMVRSCYHRSSSVVTPIPVSAKFDRPGDLQIKGWRPEIW